MKRIAGALAVAAMTMTFLLTSGVVASGKVAAPTIQSPVAAPAVLGQSNSQQTVSAAHAAPNMGYKATDLRSPVSTSQRDPDVFGQLQFHAPAGTLRSQAQTQDVTCPGTEPCGP